MFSAFLTTLQQAMSLDVAAWLALLYDPQSPSFRFSYGIILIAGTSEALGQSMVLFLNRVRKRRFIFTLLINIIIFALGYIIHVAIIGLTAALFFSSNRPENILFAAVALAYAPLIMNVLKLIPYFGRTLGIIFNVYHVLALIIAVTVTYSFSLSQAVICVSIGWLLLNLLKVTLARPFVQLARQTRNSIAGVDLRPIESLAPYEHPTPVKLYEN